MDDAPPPTDEASLWLQRIAQSHDKAAFIALFTSFAPRIKAYLRRQGLGSAAAEDLTQDVMLQVWSRAAQFDPARARASTWIFTIARNRLIDFWRQEKTRTTMPLEPEHMAEETVMPHDALDAAADGSKVRAALAMLSPEQRLLVEESYFHDRSHRMIADARKIPLGTVKSRLRLALDHLRTRLKGDFA